MTSTDAAGFRGRASLLAVTALGAELAAAETLASTLQLLAEKTGELLDCEITVWWRGASSESPHMLVAARAGESSEDDVADEHVIRLLRNGVAVMVRATDPPRRLLVALEESGRTAGAVDVVARASRPPLDATDLAAVSALASRVSASLTSRRLVGDLQHRADHDDLTGLPNRAALTRYLDSVLLDPEAGRCAVVFVDVDRFKLINDTLGHSTGDDVLREVSRRLRGVVRADDFVARFGGDEFVVVAVGFDDETDIDWLLERVTATPTEPLRIGTRRVFVTLSAGLARRRESDDADTMLRHADAAMYSAKLSPTHRWREYSQALQTDAAIRLGLESDLNEAVREDQIFCEFQPIVDLPTLRPVAHEALARWVHPDLGRIPPDTFIPVVESCGLMPVFTELVLDRSLKAASGWPPEVAVSVNLSARHLGDHRLAADILDALVSHSAAPGRLIVEITETAVMEDPTTAAANLAALHEAGVRIAVDDFGTGYTSIDDLRRLPVDLIKIDRSFVAEAQTPSGLEMLAALQALALALGAETIAEGVETVDQLMVLRGLGCRLAQGYLLSRPVGVDDVDHARLEIEGVTSDGSDAAWVRAALDLRGPA